MKTRFNWMFGMAALGLALSAPVHAAPDFMDGAFILAKRDRVEDVRDARRDTRKDERRDTRREAEREEEQGYGYGYERRHEERIEQDTRSRGRR